MYDDLHLDKIFNEQNDLLIVVKRGEQTKMASFTAIAIVLQLILCYHVTYLSGAAWPSTITEDERSAALKLEILALCYIAQGIPSIYSSTYAAYEWRCNANGDPIDDGDTYITGDSSKLNYWCAGSSSVIYTPPVTRSSCCYSSTGADTSIVSTCSTSSGACQFFGVTCDTTVGSNTYGSVTGIKLYGISLSGTLSNGTGAFSDLSNLLSLDVSYNRLGQTLPTELTGNPLRTNTICYIDLSIHSYINPFLNPLLRTAHATLTKLMINNNLFTGAAPTTISSGALKTYLVYNYASNCFTRPATYLTAANNALQQSSQTYCSPTGSQSIHHKHIITPT